MAQLTRLFDSFVWPQNNGVCSVHSTLKFLYQQANIPFEKKKKTIGIGFGNYNAPKKSKFLLEIHVQSIVYPSIFGIFSTGNQ